MRSSSWSYLSRRVSAAVVFYFDPPPSHAWSSPHTLHLLFFQVSLCVLLNRQGEQHIPHIPDHDVYFYHFSPCDAACVHAAIRDTDRALMMPVVEFHGDFTIGRRAPDVRVRAESHAPSPLTYSVSDLNGSSFTLMAKGSTQLNRPIHEQAVECIRVDAVLVQVKRVGMQKIDCHIFRDNNVRVAEYERFVNFGRFRA